MASNYGIKKRRDFSLEKLVIVIVILGIIAAIAIPRITSSSTSVCESSLRANLNTFRTAIDRYYVEHNSTWPADKGDGTNNRKKFATFRNQLTMYSKADGVVSANKDSSFPLGPYIRGDIPKLTVGANAGSNDVKFQDSKNPITADPSNDAGWMFNVQTGQIIANATELGANAIPYSSW